MQNGIMKWEKPINILIALLVITTSMFGITGNVYNDHPWAACQLTGQDAASIIIAVVFLIVLFIKNEKMIFIKTGLLGYFVYTYATFAFGPALNIMFLFYIAILSLSIFSFVLSVNCINKYHITALVNLPFNISAVYQLIVAVMLAVLWIGDIYGILTGKPLLANPTGEPFLEVYVLDLGFVIPAFIAGAIMTLRKMKTGYIITSIMLIKSTTMGFALIAMTLALFFNGYGLEMFLVGLWGCIGIIGLLLSITSITKLKMQR